MKIKTNSIEDTKKLARVFAKYLGPEGAFITMFGDIGAGKTAFVRLVLEALGVKEKITSPSFVILNEYKVENLSSKPGAMPVYHFDLYRLENEGLDTIKEELREYSRPGVLTFVEWADFGSCELPYNRLNIRVLYNGSDFDDTRFYSFEPIGGHYSVLTAKMLDMLKKEGLA